MNFVTSNLWYHWGTMRCDNSEKGIWNKTRKYNIILLIIIGQWQCFIGCHEIQKFINATGLGLKHIIQKFTINPTMNSMVHFMGVQGTPLINYAFVKNCYGII